MKEINDAKKVLRDNGYFVDNLWHIDDVKAWSLDCDNETAQKILYDALTNDYVMETIWDSIDMAAEELKLEKK